MKPSFHLTNKIKDQKFDIDKISDYGLFIQVSDQDFEFCVIDIKENKCLLVESFDINTVFNTQQLLQQLELLYDDHHLLKVGFWHSITVGIKNNKFSLIPRSLFDNNNIEHYLRLNCSLDKSKEIFLYKDQKSIEAVNIFSVEGKIVEWFQSQYPNRKIEIVHESSPFIEGVLSVHNHENQKSIYIDVERNHIQILVFQDRNLDYSNVFEYSTAEDLTYYVMFVFNELKLNPETTPTTMWGHVDYDSEAYQKLFTYIKHLEIGERPQNLKFGYVFDEIEEQKYFSLFNLHLCE